jgi:hypothetical protein
VQRQEREAHRQRGRKPNCKKGGLPRFCGAPSKEDSIICAFSTEILQMPCPSRVCTAKENGVEVCRAAQSAEFSVAGFVLRSVSKKTERAQSLNQKTHKRHVKACNKSCN